VLRLLLAPVLVWMVYAGAPGILFAGVILVAFVSDYFDGVIARRLGVATPELRHFGSRADLVFYDVVRHVFDFAKFGRDVAYHAWSSKAWGLSLAAALVLFLGFGISQPFVPVAVYLGLVAQVEGLMISIVLPTWTSDVPTIFRALELRKKANAAA
jgi:phosphatidylglycerophosphate synthase